MGVLRRPVTLTARVVAVGVLLVAFAAAAIGTATTVAMRENLEQRLNADVRDAMRSTLGPGGFRPSGEPDGFGPGQQFGTLRAVLPEEGQPNGLVLAEGLDANWTSTELQERQLDALAELPASDDVQTVDLPDDRTEVGQVGSALNTLLDHVESSLTARRRSEQRVGSLSLRPPTSCARRWPSSPATRN